MYELICAVSYSSLYREEVDDHVYRWSLMESTASPPRDMISLSLLLPLDHPPGHPLKIIHYALLVGVNPYPGESGEWRHLKGAVNDVREINNHLIKSFTQAEAKVLTMISLPGPSIANLKPMTFAYSMG